MGGTCTLQLTATGGRPPVMPAEGRSLSVTGVALHFGSAPPNTFVTEGDECSTSRKIPAVYSPKVSSYSAHAGAELFAPICGQLPRSCGQPGDDAGHAAHSERLPSPGVDTAATLTGMTGQDSPPARPRHLRPREVRRLLDVGRTTVHDWTVSGRLEAITSPTGYRTYPADQPLLQAALEGAQ